MAADAQTIEGRAALRQALIAAVQASPLRRVDLLSYALEPALYGDPDFVGALQRGLLASPQAQFRLLLNQPQLAAQQAPLLRELCRRLPSRVWCRALDQADLGVLLEQLLLSPATQIERSSPDASYARVWHDDAARMQRQQQDFDALWNRASIANDWRILDL